MEEGKRRSLKGLGGGGQGGFFCDVKLLESPCVLLPQTTPQFLPITRAEDRIESGCLLQAYGRRRHRDIQVCSIRAGSTPMVHFKGPAALVL